jgi:hypothetical protein
MPMSKYVINSELIYQWFLTSVADYELNIEELNFDSESKEFFGSIKPYIQRTLALMMYTCYLTQELSRVMKLNGIIGKDISITGTDATKRVTKAELEHELQRVEALLHKQKKHSFNN